MYRCGGLLLIFVSLVTSSDNPCRLSEFHCANGHCIPLSRYCDAINDCGDGSDERRYCTPCNRTYYGDIGKTYELELHRPREERPPFICHLTFSAGGKEYGDIVQLTFDSFTLGRFLSFTNEGCPDGYMQISETERPQVGGCWCGTSWGPSLYYSETSMVTLSIQLMQPSQDQLGYNFDFRLAFKMLPRSAAVVRHGESNHTEFNLGELITGTYCSRIFSDCDKKACRLQSPNFPGIYPRNVTCYYAVRQHEVPAGQHALISVRQPASHMVAIRSQWARHTKNHPERQLKVWSECDEVQDFVTVYDGYTTRDPVLMKFCGGDAVPEAVSSGPELLVEFVTSPYGTFLYPAPLHSLHGFQLQVEVHFVDLHSPTYTKNKKCEFTIGSFEHARGILQNPRHSISPNTTCYYFFQGRENELVWISVLKYHVTSKIDANYQEEDCKTEMRIWDGVVYPEKQHLYQYHDTSSSSQPTTTAVPGNATILARYCKDSIPRSCHHMLLQNQSRVTRPCFADESYLSSGSRLTVELGLKESTALRPVNFKLQYEFVNLFQDGEDMGSGPCARRFFSEGTSLHTGRFHTPKNVFLYGRGGATNLTCVYRFEAEKSERVKITLSKFGMGGRNCSTIKDSDLGRYRCHPDGNSSVAIYIDELPWQDTTLTRECLCSEDLIPFSFVSTAHMVEIRFVVYNMNSTDDFRGFFFEGTYEFIKTPVCDRKQRVGGASGEIRFHSPSRNPEEVHCENHPWLIEPGPGRYLYVKLRGVEVSDNATSERCSTRNRITIYSGGRAKLQSIVCPEIGSKNRNFVEAFSEGWSVNTTILPPRPVQARSVIVEFVAREPGSYTVTWLEVSRRLVLPPAGYIMDGPADCPYKCPELNACINESVWCDGKVNCPSGYDEMSEHCSFLKLPVLYLIICASGVAAIICVICIVTCSACRKRRRKQSRLKRLPPESVIVGGKEAIC